MITEHQLYRHFDANGILLYVGITKSIKMRGKEHVKKSGWAGSAHTTTIQYFASREELEDAEPLIIASERPLHNKRFAKRDWEPEDSYIVKASKCFAKKGAIAQICGVDQRAMRRWLKDGHLPRTEWTGETNYAELISMKTNGRVTKEQLLSLDWVAAKLKAKSEA